MTQNKEVKYAPQDIINELDKLKNDCTYHYPLSFISDISFNIFNTPNNLKLRKFAFQNEDNQIAVINHVLDIKRLQPEREPRYYVAFNDASGLGWVAFKSATIFVDLITLPHNIFYEDGLKYETALKAQALYGGTIKEIN